MNVSVIFMERPEKWGLRGDSYLWGDMSKFFESKDFPYDRDDFKSDFYRLFFKYCGKELGTEVMTYVPKYVRGDMQSGMVSHMFWQNTALPLLMNRFDDYESYM